MHELRRQCPVHQGSISGRFGIEGPDTLVFGENEQVSVFGFEPVDEGFRDASRFSSSMYEVFLGRIIGKTILQMDPPEHGRYRSLLQAAFSKREMERWERDFVRDLVRSFLGPMIGRGRGDLAGEFAFYYPVNVIAVACGLPVDDVPTFYHQAALLTNVAVPDQARMAASRELAEMVQPLIDERRARPAEDLLSILCHAEVAAEDGGLERLTDGEIVDFVRLLVPAGAQTTYRTLTNLLFALLSRPDQLDAVRADRSLIPRAIEEGLRWEPPLVSFTRVATRDTEIGGCPVSAGTKLNLCIHSANHDPSRWEDPDEFDLFRPMQPHLSFGQGPHICLGIHFARMELRVALEEILDSLPGLRLDPDADDVHIDGLMSRTALRLPCLWDPPGTGP
jgi:cytochrome P450